MEKDQKVPPEQDSSTLPSDPPSYMELQNTQAQSSEYPPEKVQPPPHDFQQGPPPNNGVPPGMYAVPPQSVNIAYESNSSNTRPGYMEYLNAEAQRNAQGNFPLPRLAYKHGAPLAPGHTSQQKTSGFPGAKGTTYHNVSK